MKLQIPYYSQERSTTCGIAALRMVLDYYKDKTTEKELLEGIKLHSFGTFSTDLGTIALSRGFKVTCNTFHLGLLGSLNLEYGTEISAEMLSNVKVSPRDNMIFESWKRYLQAGGKLVWDIPKIEQLESCLRNNIPCIISVNTAALKRFWKTWDNGHIVVVNGLEANKVNVLDPDPEDLGREYQLDKETLLAAWTINAVRSSNYLLQVYRT